jgi:hypothetical protein
MTLRPALLAVLLSLAPPPLIAQDELGGKWPPVLRKPTATGTGG